MTRGTIEYLTQISQQGSRTYTRNLAASERAVLDGQFNLSKVLRTTGYSHRVLALNARRLLDGDLLPGALLDPSSSGPARSPDAAVGDNDDSGVEKLVQRIRVVSEAVECLLETAHRSYRDHGEVFDDDVETGYVVCSSCGMIYSGEELRTCPLCGAFEVDFEWFGPFYLTTPERLCRRAPEEVVSILRDTPARLTEAVAGHDDSTLSRRPSGKEWCIKEIVGHIRDVEELFLLRITSILDSKDGASLPASALPWTLHEGKGYDSLPIEELLACFTDGRERMLSLLGGLEVGDWLRTGSLPGLFISILDFGTWVGVHNIGHTAQIRRRLAADQ